MKNIYLDTYPLRGGSGLSYFTKLLHEEVKQIAPTLDVVEKPTSRISRKLLSLGIKTPLWMQNINQADYAVFSDFIVFKNKNTRTLATIPDLAFHYYPETIAPKKTTGLGILFPGGASYLDKVTLQSVKDASVILTISETVKSEILSTYDIEDKKIHVCRIAPRAIFKPSKTRKKYIFCQATLEPRKNHLALVEAYSLLPKSIRDSYRLVLSGGRGWLSDELLVRIDKLRKAGHSIDYLGYVDEQEQIRLYQESSVYVQPSLYEGFGMTILEAMASGVPIACSDIPVFHEITNENASFFSTQDPQDIADKIIEILVDKKLAHKMVKDGLAYIDEYRAEGMGLEKALKDLLRY